MYCIFVGSENTLLCSANGKLLIPVRSVSILQKTPDFVDLKLQHCEYVVIL